MDLIFLLLQLTMLAITASTMPSTAIGQQSVGRVAVLSDLSRAERGETDEIVQSSDRENGKVTHDTGYEHITVQVEVVETIKSLWESEAPIVRRFR